MEIDIQALLFEFIGGLGIFLLGIKYMGEGLQKSAGDRLRDILDKFTSNPFMGVLAGIIVTVLIQSSSGTTVLTVGLVNAGFMTLRQAIGVIMGANVGTTVTAFIIGIDIGEYALPIIAVGCFLLFFFSNQKVNAIGQTIFGFGALFFGLELMSSGMSPLRSLESFHELTVNMSSNPILGVVIGTVFTLIVQSSSATIGILQGLFSEGAIDLKAALPVLFGDNLGTTITAIIASIGASVAAKRAAYTHVIFNLVGATIFMVFLGLFTQLIIYLQTQLNLNPEMTIAFAHGSFNITNTIIQFPFIGALAWIVTKIIPGEDTIVEFKPKHLNPIFIQQSSTLALDQAKAEVIRMGEYASKGLEETNLYLNTHQQKHSEIAMQVEGAINNLDRKITDYLIDISSGSLSEFESAKHTALMDSVRDIERIGDHFENIIELIDYKISNKVNLTEKAQEDLNDMFDLTISTVKQAVDSLDKMDREAALAVIQKEDQIDKMERNYRKKHIIRMNEGQCTGSAGIVFVDIISNLERIGDHAVNIAEEVLGE
ncbi:sodium-dependent phosphate transporter [Virgibacillus halodenitrificans]|uniref:Na/Pi cotransporter family protein n=1 Tax=Virgibacillus halodenitrificans TaxID=1482 RepID=A0AAC9NM52_VIRHA|nr:Na/Pi cotransporter family protein [Virgibacillus halodenitrificans]APC50227.1 sodium-dependent phosphate transporter [Virgibacillus halodenitrificans]MBD1222812.1 Na/Pi cotransporter family protein [Virgibacillus halodenitrificans]MCJ0930851.1 Na/Pi cotransporter family protein [Virgibacillus halodenitrificans]MEC2160081.1 Na/Pi cotransporter family protein [Virgibacillus halodenitrificans]WHX27521.1 Na/Pi cotransporter family protein [Virgibacillus halodenitrificans]